MLLCTGGFFYVCGTGVEDLCLVSGSDARPLCSTGGKSTAARAVLPDGSLLVANEVMRNRVQILAENLIKWGNTEVVVTNNDPSDFCRFAGDV